MKLFALGNLMPQNSAVVFDPGAAGIRAAQTTQHGRQAAVRDTLHLQRSPRENDEETNNPDVAELAGRAARMVGQGRFVGRDVALILSPPDVHFHALSMPSTLLEQSPEAVHEALAWEVAREIRSDANDLEVRYWPLPSGHRQGMNLMTVAMKSSMAREWVQQFAAARLSLRRIDVSPCAILRAALERVEPGPNGLWCLVDLGMKHTHITVVAQRTPVYVRTVEVSGDAWTRRIARNCDLGYAEAEALKCQHGIAPTPQGKALLTDSTDVSAILSTTLRSPIDELVEEMTRCCSYVSQSYVGSHVERVVLAGGGAQLPGFERHLRETLDVEVTTLSGLSETTGRHSAPELAVCLGGALRDMEAA